MDDVINGICEKMIRRHPHVFGTEEAPLPENREKAWQEIKKEEKLKKALQKGKKP